ncbi:NDR1/HIN1-like protein 13 [Nymphaea colorata]|uniref:Late embryogenesis abundant protein LEA-2 subgroup domain-containing protein n=1 Tax=Nymphaea colorata TaxID=210225 RepID=A0A5K1E1L9_9MAGN|nr:NDR1/HIN1-like protein 13 [Nymphaea colorata]
MNDRVYPASRPAGAAPAGGAAGAGGTGGPTYMKSQLYSANRPAYRPQPKRRRSKRRCCCLCFIWTCIVVLFLILAAAVAAAVCWVLFRPQRPVFTVSALQISKLNVTGGSTVDSLVSISLDAKNPNKKVEFFYDDISVTADSGGVSLGSGSVPGFQHAAKNTTMVSATLSAKGEKVDSDGAKALAADLKKNSVPLSIELDTKVRAKMGALRSWRLGIKVSCDGFSVAVVKKKGAAPPSLSDGKCAIKIRVKILRWEF